MEIKEESCCFCDIFLHGNALVLCRPMSLWFFEGPDGGIGIAFGKKPKKLRGGFWDSALFLKNWELCLDPWEWETKDASKSSHSTRTRWLLTISPTPKPRSARKREKEGEDQRNSRETEEKRFGKLKGLKRRVVSNHELQKIMNVRYGYKSGIWYVSGACWGWLCNKSKN